MYYCFLVEDIAELVNNPLTIQKGYADKIGSLCIGSLKQQRVFNSSGGSVVLTGEKVLLRCTNDNLPFGLQLLLKHGAELVETQDDIHNVENWYRLGITRRKIYELSLADLIGGYPAELSSAAKVFVKSKSKGFSAVINPERIFKRDPQVMSFLKSKRTETVQSFLLSKYIQIKTDSLGTRETRHVILNNQLLNSSRLLHSLKHTVPKSHRIKAQEIAAKIEKLGIFPSNYILDLGEFIHEDGEYLDIVEFNPISCSMCFVNNSIFDIAVPEIYESHRQLQMGFEFCYDALSYPQNYELTKISNKRYTYASEERHLFL